MIVPPTIIDIGSDEDAGRWLEELPFSSFLRDADGLTLCNAAFVQALHDAGADSAEALSFTLFDPFHSLGSNPEGKHSCA